MRFPFLLCVYAVPTYAQYRVYSLWHSQDRIRISIWFDIWEIFGFRGVNLPENEGNGSWRVFLTTPTRASPPSTNHIEIRTGCCCSLAVVQPALVHVPVTTKWKDYYPAVWLNWALVRRRLALGWSNQLDLWQQSLTIKTLSPDSFSKWICHFIIYLPSSTAVNIFLFTFNTNYIIDFVFYAFVQITMQANSVMIIGL